jgi:plasmid maintenance system antidote protein VapI
MNYPKYRVGNDGFVWKFAKSFARWRKLKPLLHRDGYHRVVLYKNGKRKWFQMHRLVLLAFVGPCPKGWESRHFPDADKSNNQLSNLCWGTKSQNCQDKVIQGTSNRGKHYNQGEKSGKAKLTESQVLFIRKEFASGRINQIELARRFSLNSSVISGIVRGKYWKEVGGPLVGNTRNKLTSDKVQSIRLLTEEGKSQTEIARIFGVDPSSISNVIRGKTWK